MAAAPECIFCKIPSFKLYEDNETLAFLDVNPVHYGHSLVISKSHYQNVFVVELKPSRR